MNPQTIAIVALRAAALALALSGQAKGSKALYALADAAEAGANVDAHMAEVAARLRDGSAVTDADWDSVESRIAASREALHGNPPAG